MAQKRAAFRRLLGELDEIERVRYDALLDWRRRTSGSSSSGWRPPGG